MKVIFSKKFTREFNKIKDRNTKLKIMKNIKKLQNLPHSGKPLRYKLKHYRRLVVKPFRIIYRIENSKIIINCFEHRKRVYKR